MKKSEVVKLLLWAQGADGRVLNELSVEVWHELLVDVTFEAAQEVARDHYRESTRYLLPADVLTRLDTTGDLGPLRDASAELAAEQKAAWCLEHGVTVAEYDQHWDARDIEWISRIANRVINA